MKLEKAIEVLNEYVYEDKPCLIGLFDEAAKLGIEALKCINNIREYDGDYSNLKLLGETED